MLKAIFFDLDGTLLPMDEDLFTKTYFKLLTEKMSIYGYEPHKLIDSIWLGTKAMYKNNGKFASNEECFWKVFADIYGKDNLKDKKLFDSFYTNEFKKTKIVCGNNPYSHQIIEFCKKQGIMCFLTTNPIFPRSGTLTRMNFVNLKEEDFELITTYENCAYCKPSPEYFTTILQKYNLSPQEVIVFGNNDLEDGLCALKANLKCYLVGHNLIKHQDLEFQFEEIEMKNVIDVINKEKNDRAK